MQNLSCRPVDTRDSHGRERFLPLSLESHLTLGLTENTWFWEIHPSYYPIQLVMTSQFALTTLKEGFVV